MKKLQILLIMVVLSTKLFSQNSDKKINEVTFLFIDNFYEKVIHKVNALTHNDKYKKHPLLYLFRAKSYYEMSRNPEKYETGKGTDYSDPLKSAQKDLYKCVKLDTKKEYSSQVSDFSEAIADTSNKLAQHYYVLGNARKSAGIYKYASKAIPNNPVLLLWQGLAEIKSKNPEGDKTVLLALDKIDASYIPPSSTSPVLARGMLILEEHLTTKGDAVNAAKAKKLVEVFKKYDPDELDKKKMEAREKKKAAENERVIRKFKSDDDKKVKGKVTFE